MRFTTITNWKMNHVWFLVLLLLLLPSRPARAQVDLTGEWSPRVYNDHMDVGDYTGIPLNEAGRLRAESWHPEQLDLPENLCRPHPIDIGLRVSVSQLRITTELDTETRQPVGLRLHVAWQEPEQVIYLDRRPHPSANAPHRWSGFSTGHWERNTSQRASPSPTSPRLLRSRKRSWRQGASDMRTPTSRSPGRDLWKR